MHEFPIRVLTVLFLAVLTALSGCGGEKGYTVVDFSDTLALDIPKQEPERGTLRVAVAAMISPKETLSYYRELLDFIAGELQYNVQLIQRKTYGEINEMFRKGQIDIAFICTGPYAVGKETYGFEALATPIVRGKPFYQSYLIVQKDGSIQKFEDLKGRVFAFTDPDSNTGFLVPTYWLADMGEAPTTFFKSFHYTYSHDNSILAVAKALVDGAAVEGHIWEYYHAKNPVHTSKTRIIKKSEPFGSPPLVASSHLAPSLKRNIRELLFSMHETPEGARLLNGLMVDRFVALQEEWYEPVRKIIKKMHAEQKGSDGAEKS